MHVKLQGSDFTVTLYIGNNQNKTAKSEKISSAYYKFLLFTSYMCKCDYLICVSLNID